MRQGTVCFFIKDNQVMLVRIRYPDGIERWNGVGGVVDEGETPEEAVAREIKEEVGVVVATDDLRRQYEFESEGYHLIVFTITRWINEPELIDPTLKEIKWFDFNEIPYQHMWEGNDQWLPKILETSSI